MGQHDDILNSWKNNIIDFALIKSDGRYSIYYKPLRSIILIEDEEENCLLTTQMLNGGVEIVDDFAEYCRIRDTI